MATMTAATCFTVLGVIDVHWFGVAAGAFAGLLLSPDLDVDGGNISDYFIRDVHSVLEFIWDVWWYVYRRVVGHRSFFSHFPVVGTVIRVLYFFPAFFAIKAYPPLFLGLLVADVIHFLMDFKVFAKVWNG